MNTKINTVVEALEAEVAALEEDRRFTGFKKPIDERIEKMRQCVAILRSPPSLPDGIMNESYIQAVRASLPEQGKPVYWMTEESNSVVPNAERKRMDKAWKSVYCIPLVVAHPPQVDHQVQ